MVDYIESASSYNLLVDTVTEAFPAHEHEKFVAHYRGLLGAWAKSSAPRRNQTLGLTAKLPCELIEAMGLCSTLPG